MRKLTAILLVIIAFSLTACANETTTTTEESTNTVTTTQEVEVSEESSEVKEWEWTDYTEIELVSPSGEKFRFPSLDDGRYEHRKIIYHNDDRCLIMSDYNSIWLANAEEDTLVCLSEDQVVLDYTVAYDTIYWFNMDREVWASAWESADTNAVLFCEAAIAVSPFTDEAEGAVVEPERANWDGYGGIPIYSPYGE